MRSLVVTDANNKTKLWYSILQEKDEKLLLRAEKDWELKKGLVAEGPFVLKHKGKYYLSYSANDTRSIYYAIGYIG